MNRFQIFKTDSTKYFTIIPKNSVDLIICDLPYGITGLKWDQVIDMDKFWRMVSWVSKTKTPTLLFGSEPFSSKQRISNLADYKYDWVWEKNRTSNFLQAKFEPRRIHENISVFYKQRPTYNPQMVEMSESSKKKEPENSWREIDS